MLRHNKWLLLVKDDMNGKFITGWSGTKICTKCDKTFKASSGSQKKCVDCRKCEECGKQLKYSHKRFCNNSCSGKWKYKNSIKVKNAIEQGRILAYEPEARQKIIDFHTGRPKLNMRGKNNPNWKGGTYGTERHKLMGQVEYKNWRTAVFKRDNYTCQHCNVSNVKLEADHIIPYIADKTKVFDINNGRTLCQECHKKTDTWGHKVHKYLKELKNVV